MQTVKAGAGCVRRRGSLVVRCLSARLTTALTGCGTQAAAVALPGKPSQVQVARAEASRPSRNLAGLPCAVMADWTAAELSDGAGRRSNLDDGPLLRAARAAGLELARAAARGADIGSGLTGANGSLT